jgi:cobalt-zinc-cadmium resistance protein CzcA
MKNKILLCTFLLVCGNFPAGAQAGKSLQECIQIATQNNLTLQSGQIAVERAKALQGTAFDLDKTTLALSQDPSAGGSPDNSLTLGQSFDFPTVYLAKLGLLKAETRLEQRRLEANRNELVRRVAGLYCQLLHAREKIRILQEQDRIYKQFVFLATAKFQAGETNRLEQMNAERLDSENQMELQTAEKNYQNWLLDLQTLLNTREPVYPADSALQALAPPPNLLHPGSFNPQQSPQNEVVEQQITVGEKNLSLKKQEFLPSFNLALRNQALLAGFNPYHIQRKKFSEGNFMGFEASIAFPLFWGGQKAKTRAAKHELQLLKIQRDNALLSLNNEYLSALNEYEKAKNRLDYYQNQGNKQAAEISRISQLAYEKGEIGYSEFIRNLETAAQLRLQFADAVNHYNQTIILILYLQGNKE